MPQCQVRLSDVLDDYCPRERRLTNHVVVALVGDEIKLTRCKTCDTEHPYKAARVPSRRQTRLVGALSSADAAEGDAKQAGNILQGSVATEPVVVVPVNPEPPFVGEPVQVKADSVRRPLIRATLALPEGMPPPPRQVPVFTVRENSDSGRKHARKRRNGGRFNGEPNGNKAESKNGKPSRAPGRGKNDSNSFRTRGSSNQAERHTKSSSRSGGKSRPR